MDRIRIFTMSHPEYLTRSPLFKSVCQPVLQPVDELLSASQLCLLLATPQLQMSNLKRKTNDKTESTLRKLVGAATLLLHNDCTIAYFGLFTSKHVSKPRHMLIHLFQLLLFGQKIIFPS